MRKELAFDLSKVAGSTYYARKNGKIVACRFNRLGVERATIPTDRPFFFIDMVFADGTREKFNSRTLPRIYFTAEDAIKGENCIINMQVCGYHRGLTKHGHHFADEVLANGNKVKVCYLWDKKAMKAVKVVDLPLYDYVNGKFFASSIDYNNNTPVKVYATEGECVKENTNIEVVEFGNDAAPEKVVEFNDSDDGDKPEDDDTVEIEFIAVGVVPPKK